MSKIFADQLLFKPHGLRGWKLHLSIYKRNWDIRSPLFFQLIFLILGECNFVSETILNNAFFDITTNKRRHVTLFSSSVSPRLNFIETITKHKIHTRRYICKTLLFSFIFLLYIYLIAIDLSTFQINHSYIKVAYYTLK